MNRQEKCTEEIKLHLGEKLKADLKELAAARGHDSLSPFIRQILREYAYGQLNPHRDLLAGAVRDE
jgi:ribbon-helix-helix protein, copG family